MDKPIKQYRSQFSLLLLMSFLALSLPLATRLVQQNQDERSKAAETTSTSRVSFKIAFSGIKPSSNCLSSLNKVIVEVANKSTSIYQSNIEASFTPVSGETNSEGDQVFLISNLILDSKFNSVNTFNYIRVKGPNFLASRFCLNNQNSKLDEITTCDINLSNTNTTIYNFSNYPLQSGDINQDGVTNSSDYSSLKNNFSNDISCNRTGDLNYDGIVNSLDASLLKDTLSTQEDGRIITQASIITQIPTVTETENSGVGDTADEIEDETDNSDTDLEDDDNNDSVSTITPTPTVWDKETYDPIKPSKITYGDESDTLKVYITKESKYYITRIWAKEPYKQIHLYTSSDYGKGSDSFNGIMEHALKKAISSNKIAVAWNSSVHASYMHKDNDFSKYSPHGLIIQDGKILRNDSTSKKYRWDFYGIDNRNVLNRYPDKSSQTVEKRKQIYDSAINGGVLNTFLASRKAVVNGVVVAKNTRSDGSSYYASTQQGVCQINKNNFMYVTARSSYWPKAFAELLKKLGCKDAWLLDAGGSKTFYFKKSESKSWKHVSGDGGRSPSWSIVYWTEL
jgi:hypothetical protein